MTIEGIRTFFSNDLMPLIIKVFVLILILLYTIFAVIVLRQVGTMNKVLTIANFSPILIFAAILHLALAIVLFTVALLIL